ncbi:unnamed protein product [Bursaphelenchus xylophilus]|uniref:(pine wood nematode) hypothetical protein n=1 Tax=Bursaphelenchus xylophilus TaxID=6326 RepID=A0A7I8X096_BURXY|nr:unnamed protein product [Bursaphelenchus xylophilus]CAG9129622.1 unnamed protein product [Bursaphelenchus xylophilus]
MDCIDDTVNGTENNRLGVITLAAHQWLGFVVNLSAYLLNICLLYLVITKSKKMKNMRPLLLIGVFVDSTYAFLCLIVNPLFVLTKDNLVLVWNSVFRPNGDIMIYIIAITGIFVAASWLCVPFQYNYRYYLIRYGTTPSTKFFLIHGSIMTSLSFYACSVVYGTYYQDNFSSLCEVESFAISESAAVRHYVNFFTLISVFSIIVVLIAEMRVRFYLKQRAEVMSKRTRRMHNELTRALIAMALSPIFSNVSQMTYVSLNLYFDNRFIVTDAISSLCSITGPLINSITTIYFVHPYRRHFKEILFVTTGDRTLISSDDSTPCVTPRPSHNRPEQFVL